MKNYKKTFISVVYFSVFAVALYFLVVFSVWFGYKDRFLPGTYIAGISVSGLTKDEAKNRLDDSVEVFFKNQQALYINNIPFGLDDLGVKYDVSKTVSIVGQSRKSPFLVGVKKNHPIELSYSQEGFNKIALEVENDLRGSVVNPRLYGNGAEVLPGSTGKRLVYGELSYLLKRELGSLKTEVSIDPLKIEPLYSEKDLLRVLPKIENRLERGLVIVGGQKEFYVGREELVSWISPKRTKDYWSINWLLQKAEKKDGKDSYFSRAEISNYLKEISKKIDTEPKNAVLGVSNGRVVVEREAQKGIRVDVYGSAEGIIRVLDSPAKMVALKMGFEEAKINSESLESLGLRELIATGYSDFSGSPSNRRHNIRIGAGRFNGMLLAPEETFSFTANMGEITAAYGYLPELVIINNETRPEYGGGLCQVSTTAFRAALNAGFPITARRPHSFPVAYYEPFGTDAAIFYPEPDLRFKNDSSAHLLIQTRIEGDYLYFDFFGTKNTNRVAFAGNKEGAGAVDLVEKVTPHIYARDGRGPGSFRALFYRFVFHSGGKLIRTDRFYSNYDSPDKFPRAQ